MLQVIADNWKSIPFILRLFLVTGIISAVLFSSLFLLNKSSQEVELITDKVSEDVKSNIIAFLQKEQIPFTIKRNKIYVSPLVKERVLMKLYTENIIPEGPDLFKWVFEMDISETREKRNLRWHISVQKKLEQMISKMENIEWAKVEFAPFKTDSFFEEEKMYEPKASLLLKLRTDKPLTKKEVLGIARFVSFAAGYIAPKNITILDTKQRLYVVPDREEALTSEQLEQKLAFEEAIEKKVYEFLSSFLTFVRVKASVEIDWKSKITKQSGIDPTRHIVTKEEREMSKGQKTASGGIPGVITRLPASEETDPESSTLQNAVTQKESLERVAGYMEITENFPAGEIKNITLAVVVQKEEIIRVFANTKKVKKEEEMKREIYLFAEEGLKKETAKILKEKLTKEEQKRYLFHLINK